MSHHLPVVDNFYSLSNHSSSSVQSLNININNPQELSPPALFPSLDPCSDAAGTILLLHRWSHPYPVLSVAISKKHRLLFAGTQDAQILVFDLLTFQHLSSVETDHTGSILSLCVSSNDAYLFSALSDSLIKIWDISQQSVVEVTTVYSLTDVGDVFSMVLSTHSNVLFFGTQNAAILWVDLSDKSNFVKCSKDSLNKLPFIRYDKFFDSKPGVRSVELAHSVEIDAKIEQYSSRISHKSAKLTLIEVPPANAVSFAHNSFIYAMQIVNRSTFLNNSAVPVFAEYLVSAGGDGLVKLWGLQNSPGVPEFIKELDCGEPVLGLAVSGFFLYAGLGAGHVQVWDLLTFQLIKLITKDSSDVNTLAYYPPLNSLFKGTEAGCSQYNLADAATTWESHEKSVLAVDILYNYTENADVLITAGHSGIAAWCLPRSSVCLASLELPDKFSNTSLLRLLTTFVGFKSISKKPEKYIDDSRNCANFVSHVFQRLGASETRLLPVENGNPVVYALFQALSSRHSKRLLWYGHYDVVETENDKGWSTDPFTLSAQDGYLHARGVTDNKGPMLAAIYAAAQQAASGKLDADIVFLIEGEEEAGSFGFQKLVKENKLLIGDIDWILFSNSYWLDDRTPCLNYGLRGLISCEVSISGPRPDRHSGMDGGVSREPTVDLVTLLSKLTDSKTGMVLLEDFYSPILPVSQEELSLYKNIIDRLENVDSLDLNINNLLKKWRLPLLTLHRVQVSGPRNLTIIPRTANAVLLMRIVPNQNIAEIEKTLVSHLSNTFKEFNTSNTLKIRFVREIEPWLGDLLNDLYKKLASAIESQWGVEPLFIREGGSIPSIRFMEKFFNASAAQIPCGQSSDNAHLNNERLRILNLFNLQSILNDVFSEIPKNPKREDPEEWSEEYDGTGKTYVVEGSGKVELGDKMYMIDLIIRGLIIED